MVLAEALVCALKLLGAEVSTEFVSSEHASGVLSLLSQVAMPRRLLVPDDLHRASSRAYAQSKRR